MRGGGSTTGAQDHADHPSRRQAVVALLSGLPGALGLETAAAKKHKRKRKKCKTKSPTCTESCASDCFYCFTRAGAPALCGDGATVNCASSCATDQDCLENSPDRPYCASQKVNRATGEVEEIGESFGVTYSCCISILPC
jgi:hypothetical protein